MNPPGQDIKDAVSDLKDAPSSPPGQTIASNPGIDDPGHQGGGGDTPNPGQDLPNPGDEGGSTVSQSGPPQTFFPDSH
ncbi:MAG: hypothetical protein HY078_02595 [Elusimicrobia bacterium]|nr:hypothetical protein [Elusimicrobiota bacterium]